MANTRILSKSAEFGIIRQPGTIIVANAFHCAGTETSGWLNLATASTNYRRVQYNKDSVIFDPAVTIDQYESTAQNGIHDEDAQFFIDKVSGLPTMTFAMPADQKTLAPHLIGALGVVSEAETPFSKTITCAGLTGPTDFTATGVGTDAFPLHAISMTDTGGSADDGKWIDNAIIQDLTLEWDFNAQGIARLMQMSGTWIGNKINLEQSMTGTIVEDLPLTPYNNTESYSFTTFTVGGPDWKALAFRRFTFTVNNNVTKDDSTTAGEASQYNISPEYTSTIILNYDDTTEKVMGDYQQGALIVATIASSTSPTADGGISIACTKGRLMSQPEIYEGEYKGVKLDIKWYADGSTTPVTIIMTDTLNWTYGAE